jgi:transposase
LVDYLTKHFSGGKFHSAYEAGYSGFWAHRALTKLGIENIVVNPSDVPTTDKEKKRKRDAVDCRKIARALRNKELKGIHVPEQEIDQDKAMVRCRQKLLADIKRCKNRIKSNLHYWGITIPEEMDNSYWPGKFRHWIRSLTFENDSAKLCLEVQLDELEFIEAQKKKLEKQLVMLSRARYKDISGWLRSIPGIGLLGAMTLITEIKDIHRFKNLDHLHSFVGLVPNINSSSDKEIIGGITQRHNRHLRSILVQCAWKAVYLDPVLFKDYNRLCRKMKASKAIIRITKKLVNRVSFVWKNECEYIVK